MKLATVLIILGTLPLSAKVHSQNAKINLGFTTGTLGNVIEAIENQSDYKIFYKTDQVNIHKQVTINEADTTIALVLNDVLGGGDNTYKVMDKLIVLTSKSAQLDNKVSGIITDASNDEPLVGVNVIIEGSTKGTISDIDGKYSIEALPGSVVVISYLGYITQKITVGNQSVIDIKLSPEVKNIDEVVVVGYGTTRKADLTGSVASVKTKDLSMHAVTSVNNMLQGQVAGMVMTLNSTQPGGKMTTTIRGAISPNTNNNPNYNSPLYVIDGIPLTNNGSIVPNLDNGTIGNNGGVDRDPLSSLNPSDIESINVLKDASSTAIYGASAANGVVLITTKKGRAGKTIVEYDGTYSVQVTKPYYEFLDATEFMQQANRLYYDYWYLFKKNIGMYGGKPDPGTYKPTFRQGEIDSNTVNTDWLKEIMRQGRIQEHNLSINGGTEESRIYASLNYYDNTAILKGSDFKRYSGRVNVDQKLNKNMTFGMRLLLSQTNSSNATTGYATAGIEGFNMLQSAYIFAPNRPVYESNGKFSTSYDPIISNPVSFLIITNYTRSNRAMITPSFDYNIFDGLKLTINGGLDRQTAALQYYSPVAAQRAKGTPNGMGEINNNRIDNYSGEAYFTYDKKLPNSTLNIVGGGGYYYSLNDGSWLEGFGYSTDAFGVNNIGIDTSRLLTNIGSWKYDKTKISQFFRANYSMLDKYLISVVGRNDGSSAFSTNHKYGFFPGIAVGWRVSQEDFLKDYAVLSDLKLRVSYGAVGNDNGLSNNTYSLYKTGYNYNFGTNTNIGVALSQLGNDNLKWETDYTFNAGLDFGIMKQRISGSFDYFVRTAKDLIDYLPLPYNNAVTRIVANVGSTRSVGYELVINTVNIQTKNLTWSSKLTASTYNAYWVTRNPTNPLASYVGYNDPIHEYYGWKTDGIIKDTSKIPSYMPKAYAGNIKYLDLDHNDTLNIKDVVKLGNTDPKLSLGLMNNFKVGNFDLYIYCYGLFGRKLYYGYNPLSVESRNYGNTDPGGSGTFVNFIPEIASKTPSNSLNTIKNIWTVDNPDGSLPGLATDSYLSANPTGKTDFNLMDASFLRIQTISLGYTLHKVVVNSIRLFVDFENVYVLTKYKGLDPEFGSQNPYPQTLTISFGANVIF